MIPSCRGAAGSVRAMQIAQAACWASEVQIFCPVSRQPPSARSARVVSPARSEPAPGSLNSWHHRKSPRSVGGRNRSCCSGCRAGSAPGTTQAPMASTGMRHLGRPHLLVDDQLLQRARRPRPHGRGRCGSTQPPSASSAPLLGPAGRGDPRQLSPHLGARGLGRPSEISRLTVCRTRGHGQIGDPGRARRPRGRAGRAATSPGGSTGAPRAPRCSRCRRAPGSGSSAQRTAASTATRPATAAASSRWAAAWAWPGPRRVPHRGGGLLGLGQHPGAAVLDRLELADRPAELVPDLRVPGRRPGAPSRPCRRPRPPARIAARPVTRARLSPPSTRSAGTVTPSALTVGHRPGQVQAVQRRDLQAGRVQHDPDRCRPPPVAPGWPPPPAQRSQSARLPPSTGPAVPRTTRPPSPSGSPVRPPPGPPPRSATRPPGRQPGGRCRRVRRGGESPC